MNKMLIIFTSGILFILLTVIGNYSIQQMHSGGFYRFNNLQGNLGPVVYYQEGIYATVTVRETPLKAVIDYESKEDVVITDVPIMGHALFINGYGQGGYEITDLRINFLISYLPLLIKPETEDALVIGLGTGTTSGQLARQINVTTIEIEPAVINAADYFSFINEDVLNNSNHTIIIDDARNYLTKENKKYNLVISEPTNTWQSFSTALFSKEFLEIMSEDIKEDGLYVQWIPIYDFKPEDFKNYYKTFSSVFPYNVAFVNLGKKDESFGYYQASELIIVGSKSNITLSKEMFNERYSSLSSSSINYLKMIGLDSGEDIYNLILFRDEELKNYSKDAEFITDNNPILEFSTAKNVLNQNPKEVINDIEQFISR